MTRVLIAVFWTVLATHMLRAETIVSAGSVSGLWTQAGSPYVIQGHISVMGGDSLLIEQGTRVEFRGYFLFTVNGLLECAGTETDSVRLTCDLTMYPSGWQGLRVVSDDTLRFAYTIVEHVIRDENSICGMELISSAARLEHTLVQSNTGNGIHAENGSYLTASDCVFRDNGYTMDSGLGSACLIRQQSTFTGTHCVFLDNFSHIDGGAIHAGIGCVLNLDSCRLESNGCNLWGAAIDVNGARLNITNCDFVENAGAKGGGLYLQWPDTTRIEHCMFIGNDAGEGAAIYVSDGSNYPVRILNCNFIQNTGNVAGVIRAMLQTLVTQSIFYGNTGPSMDFIVPGPSPEHCLFFPVRDDQFAGFAEGGLGLPDRVNVNGDSVDAFQNLFMDPEFVAEAEGDFHLLVSSPCIDAGDPDLPNDIDGTIADVGRYFYWQGTAGRTTPLLPGELTVNVYPNPFNAVLSISIESPTRGHSEIALYDLLGREVAVIRSGNLGSGQISLVAPPGLASGAYFLRVSVGAQRRLQRVILQK